MTEYLATDYPGLASCGQNVTGDCSGLLYSTTSLMFLLEETCIIDIEYLGAVAVLSPMDNFIKNPLYKNHLAQVVYSTCHIIV